MNEDNPSTHKSCPNCGSLVSTESRFCNHCAFNFDEPTPPIAQVDAQTGRSPNLSKFLLLGGGLVLALVLAIAGLFIYRSRSGVASAISTPSQPTMGDRAKQIEEKILRGETLTNADIAGLSAYELRVLRNVHFARYGRSYEKPGLGEYFFTRPWYKPSETYNDKMITAIDKANINILLTEENKLKAAAEAAAAANTPVSVTGSSSVSMGSSSGSSSPASQLTTENVQRAVEKVLDWTKVGGGVRVLGIQELPQQNQAKADIRFEDFQFNSNDMGSPVSKNKKAPPKPDTKSPNFWGDLANHSMNQVRVSRYSGEGAAILKHYNDGRWVVTGVQWNFVGVSSNVVVQ